MRASIWGLVFLFAASSSFAATPFKRALTLKKNSYLNDGVFTGGEAGGAVSLLGVRRSFSKDAQLERIIVDMGDHDAHPAGKKIGYFQASLDAKSKRVVVDLAQLHLSMVTEDKLKEIFSHSPYVASVEFTLDPEDKAGSLVLNLRRPVKMEVFELLKAKRPARVVIDLKPFTNGVGRI